MVEKESSGEKYDAMYTEAVRFQSFNNWPFGEGYICSASKMAEAGFFHCPTEIEPDLVQCYVCFKELDGWEANDEPWEEHFSHSKVCLFAQIKKQQKDLTVAEVFAIEAERKKNKLKRQVAQRLKNFRRFSDETEEVFNGLIEDLIGDKTAARKRK